MNVVKLPYDDLTTLNQLLMTNEQSLALIFIYHVLSSTWANLVIG